jgi:hypothetical protein
MKALIDMNLSPAGGIQAESVFDVIHWPTHVPLRPPGAACLGSRHPISEARADSGDV